MTKRRLLSPADRAAAQRLLRVWQEKKGPMGLTMEKVGFDLGMGKSAVSQYLHGSMPLGIEVTIRFAKLLGVEPTVIHPEWADKFTVLEPVIVRPNGTGETLQISAEDVETIRQLQRMPPKKREMVRQMIAVAADC